MFNARQEFFNSLSTFLSLMVRILFNAPSSSTSPYFTSSSSCKILFTMQTNLEVEKGVVEKLKALNKVLTAKE